MRELTQVEIIPYRMRGSNIEYLALKRTEEKGGFWQPITGGVKKGESVEEARNREMKEEIGESIKPKRSIGEAYYFEFDKRDRNNPEETIHVKEHVFGAEFPEDYQIRLSGEHTEFRWGGFKEIENLYEWESNKEGLRKLDKILIHFLNKK